MVYQKQLVEYARAIQDIISLALTSENTLTREDIDDLMHSIPQEYFINERQLSHAIIDVKKFLSDIDIREKDEVYEEYFRDRLLSNNKVLDLIITRNSSEN